MPPPTHDRKASLVGLALAFAAVYLIWGSTYLGIKYAIETIPPFLMAGARFTIAGAILYGWMHWRGKAESPLRIHWRSAFIVGGFMLMGGNGLICWAQLRVPTGLAALLVATVPLWMVLIDWLFYRGIRPTMMIVVGLAFGLLGVLVLVNPSNVFEKPVEPLYAIAVLVACLAWAIGSLYSRRAPLPKSVLLATGMEMMGGGVLLIAAGFMRGEWASFNVSAMSMQSLAAFGYLVVFGSLIGFSAYIWLLSVASPPAASTYAYVNPIVAIFLGWLIEDEPIGMRTLIAAALILAAVMLITMRRAKPQTLQQCPPARDLKQHAQCCIDGNTP